MERKNATDALRFSTAPTHHRRWISNFVAELLLPSSDDAALFLPARSKERALTSSPIPPLFHLVRSRLSRLLTSFFYFFFFFAPSAIRDQRSRKMFIRQPVSSSAENVWQSTSLMDAGLYCRIVLDFPGLNAVSLWFFSSGRVFYEVYLFTRKLQTLDCSFFYERKKIPLQRHSKFYRNVFEWWFSAG